VGLGFSTPQNHYWRWIHGDRIGVPGWLEEYLPPEAAEARWLIFSSRSLGNDRA